MDFERGLVWIRRDLRLTDHRALAEATKQCKEVAVVFVFDTTILNKLKDQDDRRVTFIHKSLQEVDQALKAQGSSLIVRHGDPIQEIPKVAKTLVVQAVFTNRDYEPAAIRRDKKVTDQLKKQQMDFFDFKDQVIFERGDILNQSQKPYKVFTPYKNEWLKRFGSDDMRVERPRPKAWISKRNLKKVLRPWTFQDIGFEENSLWLQPGSTAARKRLKSFEKNIDAYQKMRNIPSNERGTSGMSVHLRFGTISIRECLRFACSHAQSEGAKTWVTELIWREFYQMILANFPHVEKHAFQEQYDDLTWPGRPSHYAAWTKGETGYPIIDAAMRHFNDTGWMHNRLRMIVASFLTKDLLIDWRKGEAYFARKLLDFDLASNNGGWQWSASTGTDAQPYFRIFNPVSQSEKFDPDGDFIRKNLPKLEKLNKKAIHAPWNAKPLELLEAGVTLGKDYPEPIIDHSKMRKLALALFSKNK